MTSNSKKITNWNEIFQDMFILMLVVCCIGAVCKVGIASFEYVSPSEDLISIVNKNKMNAEGVNPDFLNELERGREKDANFINLRDGNGITPLMWASYANFNSADTDNQKDEARYYYVEYFLAQKNIDIYAVDKTGLTALHWAAWSGLTRCAALLINAGLDINAVENNQFTPLMLAALRGNHTMVSQLVALGADTSKVNYEGKSAYDLAQSHDVSYKERDQGMYKLIYNESRDMGHEKSAQILANPQSVAPQTIESFLLKYQAEHQSYLAQFKSTAAEALEGELHKDAAELESDAVSFMDKYKPLWGVVFILFILPFFPVGVRFAHKCFSK